MDDQSPHHKAQKRYEDRQRNAGLLRKTIWVPIAAEAEFWETVERMRRDWRSRGLLPEGD